MTAAKTTTADTVCIAGVGFAVPKSIRANSEILKSFPNRTEEEVERWRGTRDPIDGLRRALEDAGR